SSQTAVLLGPLLLILALLLSPAPLGFAVTSQAAQTFPLHFFYDVSAPTGSEKVLQNIVNDLNSRQPRLRLELNNTLLETGAGHALLEHLCRATRRGVVAVLASVLQEYDDVLHHWAQTHRILYFTWRLERPSKLHSHLAGEPSYKLNMLPDLFPAYTHMMAYLNWTQFSYLYATRAGFHRGTQLVQQLHQLLDVPDVYVDFRRVIPSAEQHNHETLKSLDQRLVQFSHRRIVIDVGNSQNVQFILDDLLQFGMNRAEYHYFVYSLGMSELLLSKFIHSGSNITGFDLLNGEKHVAMTHYLKEKHAQFLLKHGQPEANPPTYEVFVMFDALRRLLRAIDRMRLYPRKLAVPRLSCYGNGTGDRASSVSRATRQSLREALQLRQRLSGMSGEIVFDEDGMRVNSTVRVMDLMGTQRSQPIGFWSADNLLNITMDKYGRKVDNSSDTRFGNGTFIKVVTIEQPPFVMKKAQNLSKEELDKIRSGKQNFHGFCIDLAEMVFSKLGVDWDLHLVKDGKYGAVNSSSGEKVWNGMMGEVIRGEADVAIASLTITSERSKYVLFSEPFMNFGLSVMIKKPQKTKPGMFSFMQPLENRLWIAILLATLLLAAVMACLARISPLEWQLEEQLIDEDRIRTIRQDFNLINSIWFSFASFVQQGVDLSPRSASTRVIGSFWWAFSLIIMAYYTANLTACLTIERLIAPIDSVNDLVNDGNKVKFGMLESGSTKEFFRRAETHPYNRMYEIMEKDRSVYMNSVGAGIARVMNSDGKYAFILESMMNIYTNNRKPCLTMMVGTEFVVNGYGIAISQDKLELRERINEAVLELRESQDIARKYKEWWIEKGECTEDTSAKLQPLALSNLLGVFGILLLGLMLALLVALLEFCWHRHGSQGDLVCISGSSGVVGGDGVGGTSGIVGGEPAIFGSDASGLATDFLLDGLQPVHQPGLYPPHQQQPQPSQLHTMSRRR
uniref:Glutamate receptor n=1 Tax=Macrostomum lignano TaxID=282301 RepID=A0A1I8IS65_9PLAT